MDEPDVRVKGQWNSLYRAVDQEELTVDCWLMPTRERAAATAFLRKAIRSHELPKKITIAQSRSNIAAIQPYNRIHTPASSSATARISTLSWSKIIGPYNG